MEPRWLEWVKRLQAISQSGLTYSENLFDIERYEEIRSIAAEIASEYSKDDMPIIEKLFSAEAGHATPKVDVRGAVFHTGRILMVREKADGLWTLPGGWADIDEAPSEAVVREILEESGYRTQAVKLLAVYDRNRQGHTPYPFNAYKLFFRCELAGGAPACSIETDSASFFCENEIPELSLPRVTPHEISRLFAHLRDPGLPTDFD